MALTIDQAKKVVLEDKSLDIFGSYNITRFRDCPDCIPAQLDLLVTSRRGDLEPFFVDKLNMICSLIITNLEQGKYMWQVSVDLDTSNIQAGADAETSNTQAGVGHIRYENFVAAWAYIKQLPGTIQIYSTE